MCCHTKILHAKVTSREPASQSQAEALEPPRSFSPQAPSAGHPFTRDQKLCMAGWIKNPLPAVLAGLCGLLEIVFNPLKEKELTKAGAKIFSKFKRALFTKKVARLGASSSDLTSQPGGWGFRLVLFPFPGPQAVGLSGFLGSKLLFPLGLDLDEPLSHPSPRVSLINLRKTLEGRFGF